jgi:hypothetical protein
MKPTMTTTPDERARKLDEIKARWDRTSFVVPGWIIDAFDYLLATLEAAEAEGERLQAALEPDINDEDYWYKRWFEENFESTARLNLFRKADAETIRLRAQRDRLARGLVKLAKNAVEYDSCLLLDDYPGYCVDGENGCQVCVMKYAKMAGVKHEGQK